MTPSIRWFQPQMPECRTGRPKLGNVLVAEMPRAQLLSAEAQLTDIRRRHSWAPLVLVIPDLEGAWCTEASRLASRIGARVIDTASAGQWHAWRRRLTDCNWLADDFLALLRIHRPYLDPGIAPVVHDLVALGRDGETYAKVFGKFGKAERTVQKQFADSDMQFPYSYYLFGVLAGAISRLAADTDLCVAEAAWGTPYDDRTSFSRVIRQKLGTTASRARDRVPWEWIAHRMKLIRPSRDVVRGVASGA